MRRDPLTLAVCAAAVAISGAALWLSFSGLRALKSQSRIELVMTLQRQFDVDYRQDRADCARAHLYGGGTGAKDKTKRLKTAPYDAIMDFFDHLGYLVDRNAVDEEMAQHYFHHSLDGYFAATEGFLRAERKENPRRYERVFALIRRWHDQQPKPDLDAFFQEELDFAAPPPEEGPKS